MLLVFGYTGNFDRQPLTGGKPFFLAQLEKVQHRCPSGGQALRRALQLLTVPDHHLNEVPGMPEGLQHQAGIFKPMLIDRIIELAPSPFFVDLTIVFVGWVGFPTDVCKSVENPLWSVAEGAQRP